MKDNTERFSGRVEDYIKYRPRYPEAVFRTLSVNCQLSESSTVADIGSGTGILAEGFLRLGCLVHGVEPNRPMREAGERLLKRYPHFRSVPGTAEATTLQSRSVDLVTAGQAFHWFEPQKARAEFLRILRTPGWVALVWNARRRARHPLGEAYEELLLAYSAEYASVTHKRLEEQDLRAFLGENYQVEAFNNSQSLDFEGLKGRLLSSSYAPHAGEPGHEPMLAELRRIFESHQLDGRVAFLYETNLFYGRLT